MRQFLVRTGILKLCPWGVTHLGWAEACYCGYGEPDIETGWQGGVYSFHLKCELLPSSIVETALTMAMHGDVRVDYDQFTPTVSKDAHSIEMTEDEVALFECWQDFKSEVLSMYGKTSPYTCSVYAELDGFRDVLIVKSQGLKLLANGSPLHGAIPDDDDKKPN